MIPSASFYLIRHGESEANVKNIAAGGGFDSPLSAKGQGQADALAPLMEKLKIRPSRIYHSPMIRARETAERINRHMKLEMENIPGLQEHELGEWEGLPWYEEVFPLLKQNIKPKGGENMTEFAERVKSVLDRLLMREHEAPPLIVAHGGTFHSITRLYGREIGRIENCHLHRFDPYGDHPPFPWELWEFNLEEVDLRQTRSIYCPRYEAAA